MTDPVMVSVDTAINERLTFNYTPEDDADLLEPDGRQPEDQAIVDAAEEIAEEIKANPNAYLTVDAIEEGFEVDDE